MKALSIVHPGGSLIASGRKTLEVRRWKPDLLPTEDLLIVQNTRFLHKGQHEQMSVGVHRNVGFATFGLASSVIPATAR